MTAGRGAPDDSRDAARAGQGPPEGGAVERERDPLAERLDAANQELAKRPTRALRALPISKSQDSGHKAPDEPTTTLDLIRRANKGGG